MPESEYIKQNRREYIKKWLSETPRLKVSFNWWLNYYFWKNGVKNV